MEIAALVFDILVVACLIATITYAVILHRDVKKLLSQKTELERNMRAATERIQTSERNFKSIQIAAQEAGGVLEEKVFQAKELTNELDFLLAAGDNLAGRLTDSTARMPQKTPAPQMPSMLQTLAKENKINDKPMSKVMSKSMSKSEQELAARLAGSGQ